MSAAARERETPTRVEDFGERIPGARKHLAENRAGVDADKTKRRTKRVPVVKIAESVYGEEPDWAALAAKTTDVGERYGLAWSRASRDTTMRAAAAAQRGKGGFEMVEVGAGLLRGPLVLAKTQAARMSRSPLDRLDRDFVERALEAFFTAADMASRHLAENPEAMRAMREAAFEKYGADAYEVERDETTSNTVAALAYERTGHAHDLSILEIGRGPSDGLWRAVARPATGQRRARPFVQERGLETFLDRFVAEVDAFMPAAKALASSATPRLGVYRYRHPPPSEAGAPPWRVGFLANGELVAVSERRWASALEATSAFNENLGAFAVEALAMRAKIPRRPTVERDARVGPSTRDGEMSAERFMAEFGPRGVQYGNWLSAAETRAALDEAADALVDLADATGADPSGMMLGGDLALAFGARGRGGKNASVAHFESEGRVINLTRSRGAGSLAHEWFHALDHAAGKLVLGATGRPLSELVASSDFDGAGGRLASAMAALVEGIREKTEICLRSSAVGALRGRTAYWLAPKEMTARAFEAHVERRLASAGVKNEFLVRFWRPAETDHGALCNPYPTNNESAALAVLFDDLFDAAMDAGLVGRPETNAHGPDLDARTGKPRRRAEVQLRLSF